jgi:hypothetical protein
MAAEERAAIVKVLLPQDVLARVDELAAAWGSPRATVVRILLVEQLRIRGGRATVPARAATAEAARGVRGPGRPRGSTNRTKVDP